MDFSYINDKGRKVSGPPATIHFIYSENINEEIERDAKRKKYKIV